MFYMNVVYVHLCFLKTHSGFDHFFVLTLNAFSIVSDLIRKLVLRSVFATVSGTCFEYSTFSRQSGCRNSQRYIGFYILGLNQVCLDRTLTSGSVRSLADH
jgi:hypothetical protein